jgi:hypothetical protein
MREFAVVLVEHDERQALHVWGTLKQAGLTNPIKVLTDADQASQYLEREGKYADAAQFPWPCLLLVDLDLPSNQAFALLKWVQDANLSPLTAVPVCPTTIDVRLRLAHELGAKSCLTKSASAGEIVELLTVLGGGHLTFRPKSQAPLLLAPELEPSWRGITPTVESTKNQTNL